MTSKARGWTPPAALPLIAMLLLSQCGMAGSDIWPNICPSVLYYSQETRILAAMEVEGMRLGAVIAGMLCDYSMMRELSRLSPAR